MRSPSLNRQFLERFVFQTSDFLSLIVIPNPTFKADIAARAQVEELAPRLVVSMAVWVKRKRISARHRWNEDDGVAGGEAT